MKKLLSLVLALVLVLSLSVTAFAAGNYPDILYVDIGQIVWSGLIVERVEGEAGDAEILSEHLSGTLYAFDTSQVNGELKITIHYADGSETQFSVPQAETGKNLYTVIETNEGSWDTYNVPTVTNGTQNVTGKYAEGTDGGTIYKVDISWGSMAFTYTAASKGTWSVTNHVYEGGTEAGWSWADGANEITITNHSNAGISVIPAYTEDTGYAAVYMKFANTRLILPTADNGEDGAAGTATTGTITVTPKGVLSRGTNGKIGQITLTLGEQPTEVTSESELQEALLKGGNILLAKDLSITNMTIPANVTVNIDLNGIMFENLIIEDGANVTLTSTNSASWARIRGTTTLGNATITVGKGVWMSDTLYLNSKDAVFNYPADDSIVEDVRVTAKVAGCNTSQFVLPEGFAIHEDHSCGVVYSGEMETNEEYYLGRTTYGPPDGMLE